MEVENKFKLGLENIEKVTLVGPFFEGNLSLPFSHPHIFVDRGCQFLPEGVKQTPMDPSFLRIGDGDSFTGELDVKLNPVKDLSDLSYALNMIPPSCRRIELLGFLGGRKDHEMINFGEVYNHLGPNQKASFDSQILILGQGQYNFNFQGTFSLFSFTPNQITIQGNVSYPLEPQTDLPPLSSLGLSNEAQGEFQIHCGSNLMVFFNNAVEK